MKKKFTLLILFATLFCASSLHAQQGSVTAGGNASGAGGSASYSIGQVSYTTITGSGGTVTQGIQQPYEFFVLGKDDFESIKLSMLVYPNPTASFIKLSFESFNVSKPRFELYDLTGKLLKEQQILTNETLIDMEILPSTTYILKVYSGSTSLKSFKILKKDR